MKEDSMRVDEICVQVGDALVILKAGRSDGEFIVSSIEIDEVDEGEVVKVAYDGGGVRTFPDAVVCWYMIGTPKATPNLKVVT